MVDRLEARLTAMEPKAITLLRTLADRSPSERAEYYVQRDVPPAVRDEVESLLRSDTAETYSLGPRAPTSMGARQPAAISRYEVVRLLGRGGMGEVYLARDPVLDRDIAVKLIGGELDDDMARRYLVKEARAAGRLRHPNIVTIFDAGEHHGRLFIAMEYVPGETIRTIIQSRAALPLGRRLEFIEGACAGLAHAHRAGVIHLDIKPDNLMLDENGVVKVLDFGIARILKGDATATGHLAGTLRYMSPEQVAGRPMDRRSDVFSLGCSLFELVAYAPAYDGSTQEVVTRLSSGPVPSLLEVLPGIDPRLAAVTQRAMALNPSDRYDDLEDLRIELGRLRAEIDPAGDAAFAPVAIVPERIPTSRRSFPAASVAVATALVVAGAAFWMYGRTPSEAPGVARETVPTAAVSESAPNSESAGLAKTGSTEEVWRRLAAGDRKGVLQLLQAAGDNPSSGTDARLAGSVLQTVRASVLQAREAAGALSPSRSSGAYRSGEQRLTMANRLEADGRPVDALGTLWQAADLYAESVAVGQRQLSRGPVTPLQSPVEPTVGSSANQPAPPTAVESLRPELPQPPSPAATADGRAAGTVTDPPKEPSDSAAILDALRRYDLAYEALDVSGVLQVFPSLGRDQVEQLRRTFAAMTAYEIEIRNARVDVQGDSAVSFATVSRRMVPRVGRPVVNEVETEFRLRRDGSRWVITAVAASKS